MGANFPHELVNSKNAGLGVLGGLLVKKGAGNLDISVSHGFIRLADRKDEQNPFGTIYEIKADLAGADSTLSAPAAAGEHILYAHPVVNGDDQTVGVELRFGGVAGSTVATTPEPNYNGMAPFQMTAVPNDGYWRPGRSEPIATVTVAAGVVTAIDNTTRRVAV